MNFSQRVRNQKFNYNLSCHQEPTQRKHKKKQSRFSMMFVHFQKFNSYNLVWVKAQIQAMDQAGAEVILRLSLLFFLIQANKKYHQLTLLKEFVTNTQITKKERFL